MEHTPWLWRQSTKDASKRVVWRAWAECDPAGAVFLCTEWGGHPEDANAAKLQQSRREIRDAGREASLAAKANQQVMYKMRCKRDKEGYRAMPDDRAMPLMRKRPRSDEAEPARKKAKVADVPLVMLATTLDVAKMDKLVFPKFTQPKIDGFRCLVFQDDAGDIQMYSRTREIFHGLQQLKQTLKGLAIWGAASSGFGSGRLYLDGELFKPDLSFQRLSSQLRKGQNRADFDVDGLRLQVFDCFDLAHMDVGFGDRLAFLRQGLSFDGADPVHGLPTHVAETPEDIQRALATYLAQGHEGAMVRCVDAPYQLRVRSRHLQKVKEMQDDEFEVVGFREGEGNCRGMAVWECRRELPDGTAVTFSVMPGGDREHNKAMFARAADFVGRRLTVQYFSFYDSGRPRFPTGKGFRESFDLS